MPSSRRRLNGFPRNIYRYCGCVLQQGADDCFALQILFDTEDDFSFYCQRYQQDFEAALVAKFTNQFGMFKTILTSL